MNIDNDHIENYYDDFFAKTINQTINERHLKLISLLKINGLKPNSQILELGCGSGTCTKLIAKKLNYEGKIEAVDISSKTIEYLNLKNKNSNISFYQGDIATYFSKLINLDFILLFDIIEHIPLEKHEILFAHLAAISGKNTKIIINIPNPDYTLYDRKHQPEVLQLIDETVYLPFLAQQVDKNNLKISHFEELSIWAKQDYHFYVIEQKKEFIEIKLQDERSFSKKLFNKFKRIFYSIKYKN